MVKGGGDDVRWTNYKNRPGRLSLNAACAIVCRVNSFN